MSSEIVPFGKHKGQPVEVLLADQGYREWVLAQPWVRDRYPTFHQTIINYGGEPVETPEHNELQASFLDDARCLALAQLLFPPGIFDGTEAERVMKLSRPGRYSSKSVGEIFAKFKQHVRPAFIKPWVSGRAFEVEGWDVVFTVHPPGIALDLVSLPDCPCVCDHEFDCPASSTCRGGEEIRCRHSSHDRRPVPTFEQWQNADEDELHSMIRSSYGYGHCDKNCAWGDASTTEWLLDTDERRYRPVTRKVLVECKPDLGDDFPAVLRQVTRYEAGGDRDRRCVVVRRHQFEHVTWEQVFEMFRASGITMIREEQLVEAEAEVPEETPAS